MFMSSRKDSPTFASVSIGRPQFSFLELSFCALWYLLSFCNVHQANLCTVHCAIFQKRLSIVAQKAYCLLNPLVGLLSRSSNPAPNQKKKRKETEQERKKQIHFENKKDRKGEKRKEKPSLVKSRISTKKVENEIPTLY